MAVRCQPGGGTFEVSPSRQCTAAFWLLGGFRRENLPPHLAILACRLLMKAARPHRIHRQCTPLKALVWKGTPQDSSKGNRETPVLRPAWPLNLYGWHLHVGGSECYSSATASKLPCVKVQALERRLEGVGSMGLSASA